MGRFMESILDVLFPPKCVFCRRLLKSSEKDMCADCREKLPFLCEGGRNCSGEFFSRCVSVLKYENLVRDSIHRLKFSGCSGYVSCYSKLLAPVIKAELSGAYDIITWVPLSKKREKQRGYDQAMLLALATAVELDDVAVETLVKIKDVQAQSTVGGKDRRQANILGAYGVEDPELIEGRRVLLIDDVVTTGSTLSECARMLRMAGAKDVVCATVARAGDS